MYAHSHTKVLDVEIVLQENIDDFNGRRLLEYNKNKHQHTGFEKGDYQLRSLLRKRNLQEFSTLLLSTKVLVETRLKYDDLLPIVGVHALNSPGFSGSLRANEFFFRFISVEAFDARDFEFAISPIQGKPTSDDSSGEEKSGFPLIPVVATVSSIFFLLFSFILWKVSCGNRHTSRHRNERNRSRSHGYDSSPHRERRKSSARRDRERHHRSISRSKHQDNENKNRRSLSRRREAVSRQRRRSRSRGRNPDGDERVWKERDQRSRRQRRNRESGFPPDDLEAWHERSSRPEGNYPTRRSRSMSRERYKRDRNPRSRSRRRRHRV